MLQIYCKNNNSTREFPEGSSLLDIYNGFNLVMPYGPVSAKVNNKVESLDFRVYYNKDIEFLDITSSSGMRTYVRSLFFVLVKAVEELYPQGNISLEHPISKGYFCKLHIDRTIGLDDVQRIKQKMQEIIRRRLQALWDNTGFTLVEDPLRVGYYTEIDMLVWAEKFYGEKFVEYLKKTYSPLNVVFRLAQETSLVLLNGGGFDGPEWSVRASLANLNESDYVTIGQGIKRILDEYAEEWRKNRS